MFLSSVCIFLVVVLLYIYLYHQWKHNDNLEVFELDMVEGHAHVQEACELRQPFLFPLGVQDNLCLLASADMCIKDVRDYFSPGKDKDPVEMPVERALAMLEQAPPHYFSEGNSDLWIHSGISRTTLRGDADAWFKPAYTVWADYDLWTGARGTQTPFRYHTAFRRFLWNNSVTEEGGTVKVRLVPWKDMSHGSQKDYEWFEFYSNHPPSDRATGSRKGVDVLVHAGDVLYVPPYWWYSVEYDAAGPHTRLVVCTYRTAMNVVANANDLALFWLQQHNITRTAKKKDVGVEYSIPPAHEEQERDGTTSSTSALPDAIPADDNTSSDTPSSEQEQESAKPTADTGISTSSDL